MSRTTVAVIGGSGFIGTELVRQLLARGRSVQIIDNRKSAAYPELWTFADVRDASGLNNALTGAGVETLFNLAAEHKDNVRPRTLYERAPLQFWQGIAALLALALLASWLVR